MSAEAKKRAGVRQWKRWTAAAVGVLLLGAAGCGKKEAPVGQVGAVIGFGGGVVADEPRAAVIGRDVLSAGGTASDAAIAIYFALAVTYPSAASLGGGGACIVHDPNKPNAIPQVLEFPRTAPEGGGAVAVPGNVRGMAVLHARHGKLKWSQLVSPGEALARRGFLVSRAYLRSFEGVSGTIGAEEDMNNHAFAPGNRPRNEGEPLEQQDLGTILARIRANGAGDFYTGTGAREFVDAANKRGGAIDIADMRRVKANWAGALAVALPGGRALFMAKGQGATIAARLWTLSGNAPAPADTLIQALGQAYGESGSPGPLNSTGSTGWAAMDRQGRVTACAVSTGEPFGLRKVGPGTGIVLAPVPGQGGDEGNFLLPAILASTERGDYQTFGAIGAAGGEAAPAAMIETIRAFVFNRTDTAGAQNVPRVFRPSQTGPVLFEPGADLGTTPDDLRREVPALGRVNMIGCREGFSKSPGSCSFVADKRGHGLGDGGMM